MILRVTFGLGGKRRQFTLHLAYFSPISPLYLPISPLYLPGDKGREFKESAALSDTIAAYLESIVATANELPPLWSISPSPSP